jgi:hypothetical protein
MNRLKILSSLVFAGMSLFFASIGTLAFLRHDLFYNHVPELFIGMFGFILWVTVGGRLFLYIIIDEPQEA